MRIAIVGDLQYREDESVENIALELKAINPDTVVILGDYGYWDGFGSYEVFKHIDTEFSKIGCKVIPLVGNHDVQRAAGGRLAPVGSVEENYLKAFGDYPVCQILDFESFRVFCLHMETQKEGDFYFENECYLSDRTYELVCEELEKYPHKPTVMITHAPPAGCNLLTVPLVHVRASNAYLNQDHGYKKWTDLAKNNRQIVMWFSGHYHMGHSYKDSSSHTDGIAYFVTGSTTSGSRDGQRHTRIIDEKDGIITVSTYDHDTRQIFEKPDFVLDTATKRQPFEERPLEGVFTAGCGRVTKLSMGANGRAYAMTDNDMLWEIDLTDKFAAGTLHYSDIYTLDDFYTDSDCVWRICKDRAFGHRYCDTNRFMREKDWGSCLFTEKPASTAEISKEAPLTYKGRPACKIDSEYILSSYNDEDGKLFFEITRI